MVCACELRIQGSKVFLQAKVARHRSTAFLPVLQTAAASWLIEFLAALALLDVVGAVVAEILADADADDRTVGGSTADEGGGGAQPATSMLRLAPNPASGAKTSQRSSMV